MSGDGLRRGAETTEVGPNSRDSAALPRLGERRPGDTECALANEAEEGHGKAADSCNFFRKVKGAKVISQCRISWKQRCLLLGF